MKLFVENCIQGLSSALVRGVRPKERFPRFLLGRTRVKPFAVFARTP
jgi:hypothetical protein